MHCAAKKPRKCDPDEWQVEPDEKVGVRCEKRASSVVLPLRDPGVGCNKGTDIVEKIRPWHPFWSVEEFVDLYMGAVDDLCDPLRERRFARSRYSGNEDLLWQMRKRVAVGQHLSILGFDERR